MPENGRSKNGVALLAYVRASTPFLACGKEVGGGLTTALPTRLMRPAAARSAARDFAFCNESRRVRVFTALQHRGSLRLARGRRRRAADRRRPDIGAADGDAARAPDSPGRHRA